MSEQNQGGGAAEAVDKETAERRLATWREALELQKHFNDILTKIRNFYFLYFAALGAAIGAGLKDVGQGNLSAFLSDGWVLLGAATPGFALYILDRFYYHSLLVGAVIVSGAIETELNGLDLTTRINNSYRERRMHPLPWLHGSDLKVTLFYALPMVGAMLVLGAKRGAGILVATFVLFEVSAKFSSKKSDKTGKDVPQ